MLFGESLRNKLHHLFLSKFIFHQGNFRILGKSTMGFE